MKESFVALEFPQIREKVASLALTEGGKASSLALSPLGREELTKELEFLQESIDVIARFGMMPISSSPSLAADLGYAAHGGMLPPVKLEQVAHDILTGIAIRRYFSLSEVPSSHLRDFALNLDIPEEVEEAIHEAIDGDLSIKDTASKALYGIRSRIRGEEKKALNSLSQLAAKYRTYLNSSSFTIRNGHHCLAVKNEYRSKVKGLLQDVSSSGETIFIEPEELLLIQNRIAALKKEEEAEINRILSELSAMVGRHQEELLTLNEAIAYLDFLQAKALYGEGIHGHLAHIAERREIAIFGARHPLLSYEKAIPNDFVLTDRERIIVISGPNAGGKTVALKTLGLLCLMHGSGLPIPASEGAEIAYLGNILADIGDHQSLEENLSTFAGHVSSLAEIFDDIEENDLVLLDEVGMGTAPQEGEALAIACLSYLRRKGAFAIVTSHFAGVKAFALKEEGLVSASLLFDEERMVPTYRLKRGMPGESYAFEVAAKYGLPGEIITEAREYLGSRREDDGRLQSQRLLELVLEEERIKGSLEEKEAELAKKEASFAARERRLAEREKNLAEENRLKQQKLLERTKEEVGEIIASLSRGDVKLHEAIEAKKRLDDLELGQDESDDEEKPFDGELSVGDYVRVPAYGLYGTIVRVSGKALEIRTDTGASFKVSRGKAYPAVRAEKKQRQEVVSMKREALPLELNLIGMREADAKERLMNYLDGCRISGPKRVRIIHGFGSGILKRMTWDYLKAHPEFVASYESGDMHEGGLGATVVHLK